MMTKSNTNLRFDGSVWCNLDIALRSMDYVFRQHIRPTNLTVIEWYVLRSLYERDGQHASELARAVGRAATSFTPNLDKLQGKGYVERRPDTVDRRAVRIYLTAKGNANREEVLESAQTIDSLVVSQLGLSDLDSFHGAIVRLQEMHIELD